MATFANSLHFLCASPLRFDMSQHMLVHIQNYCKFSEAFSEFFENFFPIYLKSYYSFFEINDIFSYNFFYRTFSPNFFKIKPFFSRRVKLELRPF